MAEASYVLLKLCGVLQGPTLKIQMEYFFFSVGWTASFSHSMDLMESRTSCSGLAALETVPDHLVFQEFSAFRKRMLITCFFEWLQSSGNNTSWFFFFSHVNHLLLSWH